MGAATTVAGSDARVDPQVRVVTLHIVAGDGSYDFEGARAATITIQVTGTFNSGAIAINKSNDGSNFVALATAVSISSAGMGSVAAADLGARYYRLVATGGGASQDLVATVVLTETS